jgi:uncharacterized delta-60 repeat protein
MSIGRPDLVPAALALLLGAALAPLRAQVSGDLDPTYNAGNGIRIVEPDLGLDAVARVAGGAVAPDGRFWLAGEVVDNAFSNDFDFFVCRVTASGGAHSCLTVPFNLGGAGVDDATAVAAGSDGKAVVVGYAQGPANDPEDRAVFLRMTAAMTLDATFGGDGKIDDFDLSSPFTAHAVAVLPDGKVAWAGRIDQTLLGIPNRNVLVGRFLVNGAPDPSFDGDGYRVVLFDAGGNLADEAAAMAVQPDGKIVVVGKAATGAASADFAIVRLGSDGTLDNGFSGDGKLLVSFSPTDGQADAASAVAVDRFGRIVVAGTTGGGNAGVARVLANGTLDPSFGAGGKTTFSILAAGDIIGPPSLLLLPGDGILVAGDYDPDDTVDPWNTFVAVLEPDGDLDPAFGGGDGKVTFASLPLIADPVTRFHGAALFAGKVLIAGEPGFEQPDIGFALRLWMSRLFRDDFETGNLLQWSGAAGN